MARNSGYDHDAGSPYLEVFKFESTGLAACILEAADYINEQIRSGHKIGEPTYFRDQHNNHVFRFYPEEL